MNSMIKKIELDLGGKKVSLTPEQAKNLKDALDDLFGKTVIKEIHEHHDTFPLIPYNPYPYPYRQPFWEWRPGRITCGGTDVLSDSNSWRATFSNETLSLTA